MANSASAATPNSDKVVGSGTLVLFAIGESDHRAAKLNMLGSAAPVKPISREYSSLAFSWVPAGALNVARCAAKEIAVFQVWLVVMSTSWAEAMPATPELMVNWNAVAKVPLLLLNPGTLKNDGAGDVKAGEGTMSQVMLPFSNDQLSPRLVVGSPSVPLDPAPDQGTTMAWAGVAATPPMRNIATAAMDRKRVERARKAPVMAHSFGGDGFRSPHRASAVF